MGRHFKSKRLNMMVTWMHWMLANMAFIIFKCQEFTHGKRSRSNRSNWWKNTLHGTKQKLTHKELREQERSVKMSMEFWQHNWMINNFNLYLKRKSFFSGKVACYG